MSGSLFLEIVVQLFRQNGFYRLQLCYSTILFIFQKKLVLNPSWTFLMENSFFLVTMGRYPMERWWATPATRAMWWWDPRARSARDRRLGLGPGCRTSRFCVWRINRLDRETKHRYYIFLFHLNIQEYIQIYNTNIIFDSLSTKW